MKIKAVNSAAKVSHLTGDVFKLSTSAGIYTIKMLDGQLRIAAQEGYLSIEPVASNVILLKEIE